jgi:hypothetical protein
MFGFLGDDHDHHLPVHLKGLRFTGVPDAKILNRQSRLVYLFRFFYKLWSQPSTLISSEITDRFDERLPGQVSRVTSSFSGFLNLRELFDDLPELTLHDLKLSIVNAGHYYSDSDGTNLKDDFPRWRWIGVAIGSFGLMCYGWWHLRNEVSIAWGFCWWSAGVALWVYTVSVWIGHVVTP